MPVFSLIAVTMVAFAANSVLSRIGIFTFGLDPLAFSAVRLGSGAAVLALLVSLRCDWPTLDLRRLRSAVALLFYVVPFSVAYVTLPSGLGALILFGIVQLTMFAAAAVMGASPTGRQWAGMVLSMAGLGWLLWPASGAAVQVDGVGAALMVVAGVAWGVFSVLGRGSRDPLGDMAWSFVLLIPFAALLLVMAPTLATPLGGYGAALVSGAVTSGLGYALWYRVLPRIAAPTGAVAQLSVPVIATLGGAVLLSEAITVDLVLASAVVLGGIAVAVVKR